MKNSLIIHYHGNIEYSKDENIILISEDTSWKDDFINKQLQIDYLKIEDYIKASQVVNQEFGEINNIKIINHNYDLNMNIVTDVVRIEENLLLNTFAVTPEINITSHKGNILTEDDFVIKRPARLGVGLVGGVGFSYQGMTPYVGIGVTYSFYDITELFKK